MRRCDYLFSYISDAIFKLGDFVLVLKYIMSFLLDLPFFRLVIMQDLMKENHFFLHEVTQGMSENYNIFLLIFLFRLFFFSVVHKVGFSFLKKTKSKEKDKLHMDKTIWT